MTPRLDDIRRDDDWLDALGSRRDVDGDEAIKLLAQWVDAIDHVPASAQTHPAAAQTGRYARRGLSLKGVRRVASVSGIAIAAISVILILMTVTILVLRQVLPKLSDTGYDLVVVDGMTTEFPRDLEASLRLLRPGGVVVVDDVLWQGRLADPVRREAVAGALRETVRMVREDERLVPLVLPIAEGLLCATLRESSAI